MKRKNFLQRAYTVMEIRTGFATGLPVLSGGLFGAYLAGHLKIIPLLLMFVISEVRDLCEEMQRLWIL